MIDKKRMIEKLHQYIWKTKIHIQILIVLQTQTFCHGIDLLVIRNLAHESRQEIHIHYLDFHMEKSVSTILISPCDSLGKIFITSKIYNNY